MVATILIFILILGLLVLVHEFGHFILAKKSRMVVHEFGFGFPPRLIGIKKIQGKWKVVWGHQKSISDSELNQGDENTLYSINSIPLGGFVRIMGENNEHENNPKSFINKPFWPRFLTLVAGVIMNFILAAVIFGVGFGIGLPAAFETSSEIPKYAVMENAKTAIIEVIKDQPADKAGIKSGDFIVSIDNNKFAKAEEYRNYIRSNSGKEFSFEIERGGQIFNFKLVSVSNPAEGQGPTGIALTMLGKLRYPWYLAPYEGLKMAIVQTGAIFSGLYKLLTSGLGLSSLGGPVKIAQLTGQVADMGIIYLMQFTAFLSLNLAVLNIMPFPALDGGRVVFLIIEKIRGKRNNQKFEQMANAAGFALLLLLMLVVTIKDVKGF
jgi:regulator of sigma E protease